jgi:hypothetical protein
VSLDQGWTELSVALKDLKKRWGEIKEGWDDPVSRDFEERTWTPIELETTAVLRAMDRLAPVLQRAQRECS